MLDLDVPRHQQCDRRVNQFCVHIVAGKPQVPAYMVLEFKAPMHANVPQSRGYTRYAWLAMLLIRRWHVWFNSNGETFVLNPKDPTLTHFFERCSRFPEGDEDHPHLVEILRPILFSLLQI